MLALGVLLLLGTQHLQVLNDPAAGGRGLNHIIDISALRCGQGVGKLANIILLSRRTVSARAENNLNRTLCSIGKV